MYEKFSHDFHGGYDRPYRMYGYFYLMQQTGNDRTTRQRGKGHDETR